MVCDCGHRLGAGSCPSESQDPGRERLEVALLIAKGLGRAVIEFAEVHRELVASNRGSQASLYGPRLDDEQLERLETRIQKKGVQTGAGPAWLRIDDQRGLFPITP